MMTIISRFLRYVAELSRQEALIGAFDSFGVVKNSFMNYRNCINFGQQTGSGQLAGASLIRLTDKLLALVIAFCLCSVSTTKAADADNLNTSVNTTAPFSALFTIDGVPSPAGPQIGHGKWTLVMIWVTNCHSCREQKPRISAFHDAHKDVDATVVGIAMDGPAKRKKVKKFLTEYKVTFPTFVGDMMQVMKDYEKLTNESFQGTPTYLLFSPQGVLKGNNPGPITIAALERFIDRHSE